MTQSNTHKQQQAQRILELFAMSSEKPRSVYARQRYLDAGGNPQCTPSGRRGDNYMTDEERQEALVLGRQVFDEEYINNFLQRDRSQSASSQISKR
ncbi:hypothetical protein [Dendronalium sp. ChiSLP03b]|uniref:hypothetical protein n=1 Tax=Dendronalium sp. ChiSLP03b TaxID=3075381 RepID=UPI002AD59AB1|nr:hypothetical protein [Dendronalium sp. ChiSLP03b]MDZ8207935.1 hypothetical protein [Dendronalium sp. ChiSLP03b]